MSLDLAAADWNHKCDRYYTEEDDALKQDWDAKAVWCNPPYSARIVEAFVLKGIEAAEHGTTTICLLPWWNYPYLDMCEKHGQVHRISSPVTFRREDGSTLTLNNGFRSTPLIVVVLGPTIRPGFGPPIRKTPSSNAAQNSGPTSEEDVADGNGAIPNGDHGAAGGQEDGPEWQEAAPSGQDAPVPPLRFMIYFRAHGTVTLEGKTEEGVRELFCEDWDGHLQFPDDIQRLEVVRVEPFVGKATDTDVIPPLPSPSPIRSHESLLEDLRIYIEDAVDAEMSQSDVMGFWEEFSGVGRCELSHYLALLPESYQTMWVSLAA